MTDTLAGRETVFRLTAQARRRTVGMLESLTTEQWQRPTLCAGWSVHILAAHLTQPLLVRYPRFVLTALRHRADTDRAVDATARRLAHQSPERILTLLRAHTDDDVDPRGVGPVGPFADACLHLRDVARPLGLDVDLPPETWAALLPALIADGAPAAVVSPGRAAGLTLAATDADLRVGEGAEVRGRAEALALALSGRTVALPELSGPGAAVLEARIG